MSNEKRFVLLIVIFSLDDGDELSFPESPLRPAADKAQRTSSESTGQAKAAAKETRSREPRRARMHQGRSEGGIAAAPAKPEIELVKPSELVLGSLTDKSAGGYRIEVQLEQKGAGIDSVYSSRYDAEPEDNGLGAMARKRPLRLIGHNPHWPPSLALTLSQGNGAGCR